MNCFLVYVSFHKHNWTLINLLSCLNLATLNLMHSNFYTPFICCKTSDTQGDQNKWKMYPSYAGCLFNHSEKVITYLKQQFRKVYDAQLINMWSAINEVKLKYRTLNITYFKCSYLQFITKCQLSPTLTHKHLVKLTYNVPHYD